MNGTLTFGEWKFDGQIKLKRGVMSSHYSNRDGWTAEETFFGVKNERLGLVVRDEHGKIQGTVQTVMELP